MHQVGTTHLGAPGPPGAPWWVVLPTWVPSLISSYHIITYLQKKNLHCSLSRVLELKPADFDLFARSSVSKTISRDCYLVCDSIICPISFCFSGLFIANLCCLGDHVLELACQIYMVPSSSNA